MDLQQTGRQRRAAMAFVLACWTCTSTQDRDVSVVAEACKKMLPGFLEERGVANE